MKTNTTNDIRYIRAKEKVTKLKGLYIHLVAYIVVLCLLLYNYIAIEVNEYMASFLWLNISIMTIWGLVILIQWWIAFKGRFLFGKRWEERRIQKYLEEDQQQMWE
jgi:hypothetical protein